MLVGSHHLAIVARSQGFVHDTPLRMARRISRERNDVRAAPRRERACRVAADRRARERKVVPALGPGESRPPTDGAGA
jgi:hypothetical protein